MQLPQIIERVLAGHMSLDQLKKWVEENQHHYRKPPLMEALDEPLHEAQSTKDFDRLVDEYSDWEIRSQELARHLSKLHKIVNASGGGERTLLTASVIYQLSRLFEGALPRASGAFALGYARFQAKEYYDAVEVLSEAVELSRAGGDPLLEVTALSYLCDCFHQDKQFDETISCATNLRDRARAYGFRGQEALALRDLGMAHSALGRENESLESLREALRIRRSLSDDEVREQSVTQLPAFLDALGVTARKFGHFDEALKAFLENSEIHRREGDYHLEAHALSEIAYTYNHSGEGDKAVEYLRTAIRLEEEEGPTPTSQRWKMQLSTMDSGGFQSFEVDETQTARAFEADSDGLDTKIDDSSAYILAEQASSWAVQGNYEKAIRLSSKVLTWAIRQRDIHCQVVCRNILGISNDRLGRHRDAIPEFQKGIALADGSGGGASASLTLRYNLAKTFYNLREFQNAVQVVQSGIAYSQMVLTRSDSYAFRQQVVSGALPLYELFALLLSQADAPHNHEHLLAITEVVRARNMATWARIQAQFESEIISKDVAGRIEECLRQLRAAEVELDLRHLSGALTSSRAETLQSRIEALKNQIAEAGESHRLQIPSQSRPSWEPFREMEEALAIVLSPGTAVLSLFSVPEGICPSIFFRGEDGVKTAGTIIEWDRDERTKAFSQWVGASAFLRSRSLSQRALGELGGLTQFNETDDSPEHFLDQFLGHAKEHLFGYLVPLIRRFKPRRLAIIPHRELALIPYWQLADCCDSIESLTLIPSLNFLRICVTRSRALNGRTILVPDVTGTLPKTKYELETIRDSRQGTSKCVSSVFQLLEVGPEANLLHVAAHGAFNSKNAYHSGFLMDSSDSATGLFVKYARLVASNQQNFFQFSDHPQPDGFRLLTVAECMASLSLNECRLAVLSACECGLADTHGGGELTGLPTSLLVAGAKSVVAALWPVDDAATAVLMHLFYHNWAGGTGEHPSPAHALKVARSQLKQMGRERILSLLGPETRLPKGDQPFAHPIYSDAFQCYGDW